MGDLSLSGSRTTRAKDCSGRHLFDHADRLVLQTDGTRHRDRRSIPRAYERQFIREKPPATLNHCRTECAFARAGTARQHDCPPALFDYRGMDDQKLAYVACYAPVQPPFEEGQGQLGREGREHRAAVKQDRRLGTEPATDAACPLDANPEIRECGIRQAIKVGVEEAERAYDVREGRPKTDAKRAGLEEYACLLESFAKTIEAKVAYSHDGTEFTSDRVRSPMRDL